jgi:hypothetical protein
MRNMKKIAISSVLFALFSTPSHAFLDGLVGGLTSVTNNLIDSTESVANNTVNNANSTAQLLASNPGKMADRVGQMADRIGYMGDRIVTTEGLMAGVAHKIMDGSSNAQQAPSQPFGWGFQAPQPTRTTYQNTGFGFGNFGPAPAPAQPVVTNPYMPGYAAPAAPSYSPFGNSRPNNDHYSNERYSASNMIFGNAGSTYTAQRQAQQPAYNPYQQNDQQSSYQQAYQQGYQAAKATSGYGFAFQPQAPVNTASNNCGYSYGVPLKCN